MIDNLIGKQQVGFLKGRQIAGLLRNIDDLLNIQKGNKIKGILLALDFRQAFDSINISFITKSLGCYGFGINFIKWITILNTDRIACVKNGGHISKDFPMNNGVRQGCPISPQLFILAVELLAQKILQDSLVKGIKPAVGLDTYKIFQYADDTTLALQDKEDMKQVFIHLNGFSVFSDLHININKSYALSINGAAGDLGDIGVNINFNDKIKILGIWFSSQQLTSEIQRSMNLKSTKL